MVLPGEDWQLREDIQAGSVAVVIVRTREAPAWNFVFVPGMSKKRSPEE